MNWTPGKCQWKLHQHFADNTVRLFLHIPVIQCRETFRRDISKNNQLTDWGRVTHICVGILTIIGPDNGLSPSRRQAIIWTNVGLLSIGPLQTYFREILTKIQQFPLKKMHLKMSSAKRRLCCLGLNVLRTHHYCYTAEAWHEWCRKPFLSTNHPFCWHMYMQHKSKTFYLCLPIFYKTSGVISPSAGVILIF